MKRFAWKKIAKVRLEKSMSEMENGVDYEWPPLTCATTLTPRT